MGSEVRDNMMGCDLLIQRFVVFLEGIKVDYWVFQKGLRSACLKEV
jgi:hypothetical protein